MSTHNEYSSKIATVSKQSIQYNMVLGSIVGIIVTLMLHKP